MNTAFDLLEERVSAVTERLAALRVEIGRLERSLAIRPEDAAQAEHPAGRLAEENRRLLGERARIRERIRELIEEIDRAL